MRSAINDVERQLRTSADSARLPAPMRVRFRTIEALRTIHVAPQNPFAHQWRRGMLAVAAVIFVAASIAVLIQEPVDQPAPLTNPVASSPILPRRVEPSRWSSLRSAAHPASFSSPLVREAHLLQRDGERILDRIGEQFRALPRLEGSGRSPSTPQNPS